MAKAESIWQKVLDMLSEKLSSITMATFFSDSEGIDLTNESIVVDVKSIISKDVIENHYADMIEDMLYQLFSVPIKCVLLAGEESVKAYNQSKVGDQVALSIDEFTFSTFVVGKSNQLAHAAAMAVADNPAKVYNPLFIYGGSGLGKTHLLYAIANTIRKKDPTIRIIYIKCEEFTNELITSIRTGKNNEFRGKYRLADLLLVDDIQFIAGKDSTQEEFFHTFNSLYEAGKQIVLTSDRPPKDMANLEYRLRTRFESGLMCDIQPPDLETRIAIIHNKAASLGLDIKEDAISFLAESVTDNVRQLEGVVKKVQAFCRLLGQEPNIETVSKAIKDIFLESPAANPTPDIIITETEKYFCLNKGEILGNNRTKQVALARHISAYLSRTITGLSFPDIGLAFKRHYSTIMHSCEYISENLKSDPDIAAAVKDITANIKSRA